MELYALGIDQARDVFGANDRLAQELREVAAESFPAPRSRRPAFRPLLRRDRAFAVDPELPRPEDLEAVLTGGFVAPGRTPACWRLFEAFVAHLARSRLEIPRDGELLDRVEFDLARGGLSSTFALRRLAERPLQIPLRPLPGQFTGYAKHRHARETGVALRAVLTTPIEEHSALSAETRSFVSPIADFLEALDPGDDVIVLGRSEGPAQDQ